MDSANGHLSVSKKDALLGYLEELRSLPVGDIYFTFGKPYGKSDAAARQPWARFSSVLSGECCLEVMDGHGTSMRTLLAGDVMVMPELTYCRNTFTKSYRFLGAIRRNNYLRIIYHDFSVERQNCYSPDIQYHIEDTLHLSTIHGLSAFMGLANSGASIETVKGFYSLILDLIMNDLRQSEQKQFDKSYFIWMNVAEYIERNYDRPLTRALIGQEFKVSESYLSKLFRRYAGVPVNEFQTRIRMVKALELLKDPALTISEIAYNCGYQSVSFFIRKFHDHYSTTPAQYRLRFL